MCLLAGLIIVIFILIVFKGNKKEGFTNDIKDYRTKFHSEFIKKGEKYTIPFPVYYINMDKNRDRLQNILREKETYLNADMFRIKGFDGSKIKNKEQDTVDGVGFVNHYTNLDKGAIGCCLSHLIAIYNAWEIGDEIAMIVEDDISFVSTGVIPKIENIVNNAPDDWDILQLVSLKDDDSEDADINYLKREYPSNSFWSTVCYIINRRGIEKIINITKPNAAQNTYHIRPIRTATEKEVKNDDDKYFPILGCADCYIYDLVNTYSTSISLFMFNTELESTIHPDHASVHLSSNLSIAKTLDKYKSKKRELNLY